jgi:2-polyprenyl-6-methoxyphenol hydroxylase-like FAD-dependent oxidoreductase
MRNITVIGAGQSGLQLGLGLLQNDYRVRLVSNRTAEDIATGKVMSSQFMFDDALQAALEVLIRRRDVAPAIHWSAGHAFEHHDLAPPRRTSGATCCRTCSQEAAASPPT